MKTKKTFNASLLSLLFSGLMFATNPALAKTAQNTIKIDGYTLHGCTSYPHVKKPSEQFNKNYCTTHQKDLKEIINTSQTLKVNFDGDKKLLTHKYKNKNGEYVTDIFVLYEHKKRIDLLPNYAIFSSDDGISVVQKYTNVIGSANHNFFCLYEKDALFSESYLEGYVNSNSPVDYDYEGKKIEPLCVSYHYETKGGSFSDPFGVHVFSEYEGSDIEAFVNKSSKSGK